MHTPQSTRLSKMIPKRQSTSLQILFKFSPAPRKRTQFKASKCHSHIPILILFAAARAIFALQIATDTSASTSTASTISDLTPTSTSSSDDSISHPLPSALTPSQKTNITRHRAILKVFSDNLEKSRLLWFQQTAENIHQLFTDPEYTHDLTTFQHPIFQAVELNQFHAIKWFLTQPNTNPDMLDSCGRSLLTVCAESCLPGGQSARIARVLCEGGATVDLKVKFELKSTALFEAITFGNLQVAKVLLNHKADINLRNENRDTLLTMAIRRHTIRKGPCRSTLDVVNFLLRMKASVNQKDGHGFSPLFTALHAPYTKDARVVKALLNHNANIDDEGWHHNGKLFTCYEHLCNVKNSINVLRPAIIHENCYCLLGAGLRDNLLMFSCATKRLQLLAHYPHLGFLSVKTWLACGANFYAGSSQLNMQDPRDFQHKKTTKGCALEIACHKNNHELVELWVKTEVAKVLQPYLLLAGVCKALCGVFRLSRTSSGRAKVLMARENENAEELILSGKQLFACLLLVGPHLITHPDLWLIKKHMAIMETILHGSTDGHWGVNTQSMRDDREIIAEWLVRLRVLVGK